MRSKYIKKSDIERLRAEVGKEAWLPLEVSLVTGLRIGDVVALKARQIARDADVYYIRYVAHKTGKAGSARLPEGLGKRLKARNGEWLFPSPYNGTKCGHITRQAVWGRMKRAAARLGIDGAGVSPHSLRKNFAVALRHERGLEAVREALQHSNDAVTRVYAYADTVLRAESDEPILWRDLEIVVEYILERIQEKTASRS